MVTIEDRDTDEVQLAGAVRHIMLSDSETDYMDQLIPTIKDACVQRREDSLMAAMARFAEDIESEIEQICNANHQAFVSSVDQVSHVRKEAVHVTSEVLVLTKSIHDSTHNLAEKKKALVDLRKTRQNIEEARQALQLSLEVLRLANSVHELLHQKKYYAALRTLDELQNVHLKEVLQYNIARIIQKSVPSMKNMVKEAVMQDLNDWLFQIRESSKLIGQVAFDQTELRRRRQKERAEKSQYFEAFKLNSAVELVLDEREEFDVLENEHVVIEFTPLYECLHIYGALGLRDEFRVEYSDVRAKQKELLITQIVSFKNDDIQSLAKYLEDIAGFAIIERATIKRTQNFRSASDVDELWDSMCHKMVNLVLNALNDVENAETVLKIKAIIALFIQTMDSWEYPVEMLDGFLLKLFDKYSNLLKNKFARDFADIVAQDDYMPMSIADITEYEKVMGVTWYKDDTGNRENMAFPCILPFSQMYPLTCIDIRSFMNKYYYFPREYFSHHAEIDETLRKALDEMLTNQVCKALMERLKSKYLGQIVQILINLEHFEYACGELEKLLRDVSSSSHSGPVHLQATEEFRNKKKTAEKRIFELVNSKIDDLVEAAEYNWLAIRPQAHPSQYLQAMTRFLSDIMDTTLVGLPKDIKGLIYFDALSHLASVLLALPLADHVRAINQVAVADLDLDVRYLEEFVAGLGGEAPMLPAVFDELRQTIDLLKSNNPEEFYDISVRMRKYTNVDPLNGPRLMEKLVQEPASARPTTPHGSSGGTSLLSGSISSGLSRFRDRS